MADPIVRVTLPWPDKRLSPNSRNYWAKNGAAAVARRTAAYLTREAYPELGPFHPGPLVAKLYFFPPTTAWFDTDGLITRCKNYQDGLFDVLGMDDHLIEVTVAVRCGKVKGGQVIIEIYRKDAGDTY